MRLADIFGLGLIAIGVILILIMYGVISVSIGLVKLWPGLAIIVLGILIIYFKDEEKKIEQVKD